ncbi:MAG: DUF4340 domain-containing protein [Candidatus Omnitrophica bacterium]|nr:DUF4340 domain-containing protein [Candidatus Omnitrophota bacterium]
MAKPPSGGRFFAFSPEVTQERVLPLSSGESILRIVLKDQAKASEIEIAKKEKGWDITKPVDYPAESLVIDGLVTLLKLAPRLRQFSLEHSQMEEFGFTKPRLTVCVRTNQRSQDQCLLIGQDAALVKGAYAKWDNESKYFLVHEHFLMAFDKTLYSLRKKQLFSLLGQEIQSIHFMSKKREYVIEKKGKEWLLQKPAKATIGSDAIDALLVALSNLFVKEFLDDENAKDPRFGFDPPRRQIKVQFQDGSKQALIQGREAAGRDAYYALGEDEKTVLLISRGKLDQLEEGFRKLV